MPFSSVPILAGMVSTAIFVVSYLPMLIKAMRTRDLTSYSAMNLLLTNVGNAVHSLYVYALPVGPIWALHTFYVLTGALMMVWYIRYTRRARSRAPRPVATHDSWSRPCIKERI